MRRLAAAIAASAALSPASAGAQGAPPPPSPPPSSPPPSASPPPSYEPAERPDPTRVRFAAGLAGGGVFGDATGGMGGLFLQLGVQLGSPFAIYYQAHPMLGAWVSSSSGAFAAMLWNAALGELTLFDHLQLGVGPSIDLIAGCAASTSAAGCGDGAFFGIDDWLGVAIGSSGPGRRGGLMIGADIHPTFIPNGALVAFVLGIGGGMY